MHSIVWDAEKAEANYRKHGIRFSDATAVLSDPLALTIEEKRYDEQRFVTVGADAEGRVLIVVWASSRTDEKMRLISARRATPSERRQYEQGA